MDMQWTAALCVLVFLGGGGQNLLDQQASACLREEGEEQVRGLGGESAGWGSREWTEAPSFQESGLGSGCWPPRVALNFLGVPCPLPPPFSPQVCGAFGAGGELKSGEKGKMEVNCVQGAGLSWGLSHPFPPPLCIPCLDESGGRSSWPSPQAPPLSRHGVNILPPDAAASGVQGLLPRPHISPCICCLCLSPGMGRHTQTSSCRLDRQTHSGMHTPPSPAPTQPGGLAEVCRWKPLGLPIPTLGSRSPPTLE